MKMKKVMCRALYEMIFSRLPNSMSVGGKIFQKLRGWAVKNYIVSCGENINVEDHAKISSKVSLGNYSGIGIHAIVNGTVVIGDHVIMGRECIIMTRNHAFARTDIPIREQGFQEEKPVFIGNDVWIGHRVTILPGSRIGDGVIVGAGAVVSGEIPAYTIVGGVPARVIRKR